MDGSGNAHMVTNPTSPSLDALGKGVLRGVTIAAVPGTILGLVIGSEINATYIYLMATTLISLTLLTFIHNK